MHGKYKTKLAQQRGWLGGLKQRWGFSNDNLATVASYAMVPAAGAAGIAPNALESADRASDLDAEGEEEIDVDFDAERGESAAEASDVDADGEPEDDVLDDPDAEGEDEDAEGEEEDQDDVEPGYHGAVKVPDIESVASDAAGEDHSDEDHSASDNSDDSSSESGAENEWEAGSAGVESGEIDIAARNNCM